MRISAVGTFHQKYIIGKQIKEMNPMYYVHQTDEKCVQNLGLENMKQIGDSGKMEMWTTG